MASEYHRGGPKGTTTTATTPPQALTNMPMLYEASGDDVNDRLQEEEESVRDDDTEVGANDDEFLDGEETVNMIDDLMDQLGHQQDQWSEESFGGGSLLMEGVSHDDHNQQNEASTPTIREDETEATTTIESPSSFSNGQIAETFCAESFDGDGDCASSYEEISVEDDEDEQYEVNVVEQQERYAEANAAGENQFDNSSSSPTSTAEDMTNEEESQGCHSDLNSELHQFSVEEVSGQAEGQEVSTHNPSTSMYAREDQVSYDGRMDLTSDDDDDDAAVNETLGESDSREADNTFFADYLREDGRPVGTLDKPIMIVDDSGEEHADEMLVQVSEEPDREAIAGVKADKPIVLVADLHYEDMYAETDRCEGDSISATDDNESNGEVCVTSETNGEETTFGEVEESAQEPTEENPDTDLLEKSESMSVKSGEKADLVIEETLGNVVDIKRDNDDLLFDTGDIGSRPTGEMDRYSDEMRNENVWEGRVEDDDDKSLSEPKGEIADFTLDCDLRSIGADSQIGSKSEPRTEAELVTHIILDSYDEVSFKEYVLPNDEVSGVGHDDPMESYEEASFEDYVLQTDEGSDIDHEDDRFERETDVAVVLDNQSNDIEENCISNCVEGMGREDTGTNTRPTHPGPVYIDAECEELLVDENMPLDEVFVCGDIRDDGSASSLGIENRKHYSHINAIENEEGDILHQERLLATASEHILDGGTDPNHSDEVSEPGNLVCEPDYAPSCEGNEERQPVLIEEPMSQTVFYPEPMKRSRFGRSYNTNPQTEDVEDAQLLVSDDDNRSAAEGSEINPIVLDDTMDPVEVRDINSSSNEITDTEAKDTERAIVPSAGNNDLRACLEAFGYYLDQRFGINSFENDMSQADFLQVGLEPPSGASGIYRAVPWNPDPEVDGGVMVRRQDISRVPSSLLGDFAREGGVVRSVFAKDSPSQETVSNKSDSASIYTNPQADVPTPLVKGAHATDRLGTSLVVPSGTDDQDGGSGVEYSVIAESLGMGGVEDALLEAQSNKTEEKSRKSVTWNEFAQVRSDDPHLSGPLRVHETTRPPSPPKKNKGARFKKACEIFHDAPFWTKVLVYVSISLFCIAFGIIMTAVLGNKSQSSSGGNPIPWVPITPPPSASPTLHPTRIVVEIVEHSSPTVSPTANTTTLDALVNGTAAPSIAADRAISPEPTPAPSGQSSARPVRDGSWLWGN